MDLTSYIEVKPDFDFNNMTRYARIKMNWLFQQTGVFTNLVKVPSVFKNTFTPDRYILTDNNKTLLINSIRITKLPYKA